MDLRNQRTEELLKKKICRFCLTQDEQVSSILNTKINPRLQIQILACVSIEVRTFLHYHDTYTKKKKCNFSENILERENDESTSKGQKSLDRKIKGRKSLDRKVKGVRFGPMFEKYYV